MQEVLDEALHRLYAACKTANAFPGTLPTEPEGRVTTEDILYGLGLATTPAPFDNVEPHPTLAASRNGNLPVLISEEPNTSDTISMRNQMIDIEVLAGAAQTSQALVNVPLNYDQNTVDSSNVSGNYFASPMALDMCEQFNYTLSRYSTPQTDLSQNQVFVPSVDITTFPEPGHDMQLDFFGNPTETSLSDGKGNDALNGSMKHAQVSILRSTSCPSDDESPRNQLLPSASAVAMDSDGIFYFVTMIPDVVLPTNPTQNTETPSAAC